MNEANDKINFLNIAWYFIVVCVKDFFLNDYYVQQNQLIHA